MRHSIFFKLLIVRSLVIALCVALGMPLFTASRAMAAPGGTVTTPIVAPGFLFEPESTIDSLKTVTQWNEIEQLLDNPYAVILEVPGPAGPTPGNDQGFPSYTTDPAQFQRRRSYLPPGCSYQVPVPTGLVACNDAVDRSLGLPQFFVHSLNYNPTTG